MIVFFSDYDAAKKCAEAENGELVSYSSNDYIVYSYIAKDNYDEEYAKEYQYAVYYMNV